MKFKIPGSQSLRRNIWSGLLSATDQEIRDGMDFYPGAYGLCRLFSSVFSTDTRTVAGIVSPRGIETVMVENLGLAYLTLTKAGWTQTVQAIRTQKEG